MAAKLTNGSAVTVKKTGNNVVISGGNGADVINADALFSSVAAGTFYQIIGGNGADLVNGSSRDETIWGDSSGSSSTSDNGSDTLNGGAGKDQIHGGNGADAIAGDAGADNLWGDRGPDRFIYKAVGDSNAVDGIDIVEDFASLSDKLDLTLVPLTGSDPPPELQWLGNVATGDEYGVWWYYEGGFTKVFADTDGDGIADLEIHLRGNVNLVYGDFLGINIAPVAGDDVNAVLEDSCINGTVAGNDSDLDGDILTYSLDAPIDGLTLNADGSYTFDASGAAYQSLAQGESVDVIASYTVDDGHGGSDTATLTVTVTGVNDDPDAEDDDGGSVAEDDGAIFGSVADNDDDADNGAVLTYALADPAPAGFSMDDDGNWSFDPSDAAYQMLAQDEPLVLSIAYTVTDEFGGSDTATLTIRVTGVNDAAEFSGDDSGAVTEDGTLVASGALVVDDIDGDDSIQAATIAGTYGSLDIDAAGNWTYTLDNDAPALDDLDDGESDVDVIIVTSADGTTHEITITVNGADEAPAGPTLPTAYTGPDADPNDKDGVTGGGVLFSTQSNAQLNNANILYGTSAGETIDAKNGLDTVYGWGGDDTIIGGQGVDTIYAGSGNDNVTGDQDNDSIYGGSGSDTIAGNQNDDLIVGGYGADALTGNQGADTFRYLDVKDTNDTITDFVAGTDKLDLVALDFGAPVNASAFGAGQDLIWYFDGTNTIVLGDTDGNLATAELMITLIGNIALSAGDFIV